MLNIEITKFPIIIISSARCGSTVLGEHLANKHNLTFYNEPDLFAKNSSDSNEFLQFINACYAKNDYVLKVMSDIIESNIYPTDTKLRILSDSCYKIKIIRNKIVEQIASFYIARNRGKWAYTDVNVNKDKFTMDIVLNINEINHCIKRITYQNNIVKSTETDLTLVYEDFSGIESRFKKTPQPRNYDELLDNISRLL
jgi:LPS sulfotransferase NodH